ncbi:MAG: SPOR domain-containing protein [Azonexus sp.]
MKTLVFLLVLGNLLFYAFTAGHFGRPDNPDAGRVEQQVAADRLRIVSRGEAPVVPTPAGGATPVPEAAAEPVTPAGKAANGPDEVPATASSAANGTGKEPPPDDAKPVETACLAWRQLTVAEADQVAALLGKRFADYKLSRKTVASESNGWWVYIPALPSKADAERKAGELRNLGVTDFFIVQEGASRHAISLGIFSSDKGAGERLAELKGKGVRSAVVGPRPGKDTLVALQARGPADKKAAVIAAVAGAIQKNEALACK